MYLVLDGTSAGPFTLDQVRAMWTENKINAQTLFFREGQAGWLPLAEIQSELAVHGSLSNAPALDPSIPSPFTAPAFVIPGFWRRFAGVLIDFLVLGVIGFALGSVFFDLFVEMGAWGRLVGFIIAGAYFGVLDSAIGGGRTVGKMALGLRVVGADGNGISLGKSLLRYSIWGVPYSLNELPLSNSLLFGWLGITLGLFLWTALFALCYLLAFNRRTRQSVHDLLTDTYVIRAQPVGVINVKPVWKGHYAVIGAWVVLGLIATLAAYALSFMALFTGMLTLSNKVEALPDVQRAAIVSGTNIAYMNGQTSMTKAYTVTAFYTHPVPDVQKAAKEVATVVLTDPDDLGNPDVIAIKICRAYSIGIASGSWVQVVSHTPDEWRREIAAPNPK